MIHVHVARERNIRIAAVGPYSIRVCEGSKRSKCGQKLRLATNWPQKIGNFDNFPLKCLILQGKIMWPKMIIMTQKLQKGVFFVY
jgi:hypothetical protein